MISFSHNLKRGLLVLGDAFTFEIALFAVLWIRYGQNVQDAWHDHFIPFSIVVLLWLMGFYIAGLYDTGLVNQPLKLLRTYLEGMIANLAVAVAFFYLLPFFGIAPRTNLFYYFAFSLLLGYLWRLLFIKSIDKRFSRGRVIFIGAAEEVPSLHKLLGSASLGLDLAAAIPLSGSPDPHLGIRWGTRLEDLDRLLKEEHVTTVVCGAKLDAYPGLENALYRAIAARVTILDRAEIEEVTTGRIPLSYVSQSWFLYHLNEADKTWYETAKRIMDIFLAIPFAVLTILLYPFIALAIKFSSPGPVLYTQTRVGKHGVLIKIVKFRTMHMDAEKYGPQFTADAKTDPRLFTVGRIIRQLRIDELPQIWNVLRGDLSLIGPRPERPEFVVPLIARMPHYALRHLTRPGLTGWAQVQFLTPTSSLDDNLTKLQYDLYYIRHRSPLLDVAILLKTIGIVLRRQGT
ncbi:MAG: exopolysaccharide biosynthesis polyprenyl glycosylphosphotransferase [Patescibacteria group bacterium]